MNFFKIHQPFFFYRHCIIRITCRKDRAAYSSLPRRKEMTGFFLMKLYRKINQSRSAEAEKEQEEYRYAEKADSFLRGDSEVVTCIMYF